MNKFLSFILCCSFAISHCFSQKKIPLWSKTIPNQHKSQETEIQEKGNILWIRNVQKPTLEVFLPVKQNATGKAVVICPGGGYGGLAYDWEGTDIAKWLNSKGISAFVLKYRLPISKTIIEPHKAPLQDVQRALKLVRYHAEKWNIKTDKIGIMGFSAGGHLAASLGTHFAANTVTVDEIDAVSAKPNFMALIYPVISMKKDITHQGSKTNLLGKKPSKKMIAYYSNELQVTKNTPPTFIIHASDDKVVPVKNSLLLYEALQKENIYTEMHIYPKGGHGFGLGLKNGYVQNWTEHFIEWVEDFK